MRQFCEYSFSNIIDNNEIDTDYKLSMMKECIDLSNVTGFDINYNESEALFIERNDYAVVKLLVENGINVSARNNQAIIDICKTHENFDIIKLLIAYGADPLARNNEPISLVGNIDTVKFFINLGADPFAHNNKLFRSACIRGNKILVDYLISIGANCTEPNNMPICSTYFHCGRNEIKKLLLDNGADPNTIYISEYDATSGKEYLLDKAIRNCDYDGCKLLLEYGADVNLCHYSHRKEYSKHYYYERDKMQQLIDLFADRGKDISYIIDWIGK